MNMEAVRIEGGFAEVGAGAWLMSHGQPAAFFGSSSRSRLKGWFVRDRPSLDLVETTAAAKCADASRPFLTHVACAAPVFSVSSKVLVAPAAARRGSAFVKAIPMSSKRSLCVTEFAVDEKGDGETGAGAWVVMATASRTCRMPLEDGQTLSVRPESVVAWTGKSPTGFCPRLSLWDVILPRGPRELLYTFYGPGVVWIEGTAPKLSTFNSANRRVHGV